MPLSPPKPLDPNLTISKLTSGGQRQNSPMKQDPVLASNIHHVASTDLNTALMV